MLFADNLYKELLDAKIRPEDARYVLPNACTTEIVMSGNFRNWRWFLKERLSKAAQWEIRNLAEIIAVQLSHQAPNVFGEFVE
jgi:thymidylate synthase (FAD)